MVIQWPGGEPPYGYRVFPHNAALRALFRRGNKSNPEYARIAKILVAQYLTGRSFPEAFRNFLSLCETIDWAKQHALGLKADTTSCNHFMRILATLWVMSFDVKQWQCDMARKLSESLKDSEDWGWYHPKAHIVHTLLFFKQGTVNFAQDHFAIDADRALERLDLGLRDWRTLIDSTMSELMGLRKYGVKPCYFQDGAFHRSGQVWVFQDPVTYPDAMSSMPNSVAIVNLAKRSDMKSMRFGEKVKRSGPKWSIHGMKLTIDWPLAWTLKRDGELDILGAVGLGSVREIFESLGLSSAYEMVRLAHIVRFYDLVVPIQVIKGLPALPGIRSPLLTAIDRVRGKVSPVEPSLVIPRIRLLENRFPMVLSELEREFDEAIRDTEPRKRRAADVVHHIRNLPKGHRPSRRAREMAWEQLGVVLGDHETYVKAHGRSGTGEKAVIHRARSKASRI